MSNNNKPLFARQSIYDANYRVLAFELLFRQGNTNESGIDQSDIDAGDRATSNVISEFFANVPIEDIVGDKKVYINFTRKHILDGIPHSLPKQRVAIELLENIDYDEQIFASVRELKEAGYTIALDDFVFDSPAKTLIPLADIIKFDVLGKSNDEIRQLIDEVKDFKGYKLAEKIDNQEQYEFCKVLGFDLFQGFFLDKPIIVEGKEIGPLKTNMIKLMAELQNPDIEFVDIEKIVNTDPKLTYRILLIANSAAINMGKKVTSISEALIRLGLKQLKTWVSLLILSKLDDTPIDLLEKAIFRAKMCESLAGRIGSIDAQTCYTVGLVSTLEGILKVAMGDIVSKMNLSEDINLALLERKGLLGNILKTVNSVEQADFSKLDINKLGNDDITNSYFESIKYARNLMNDVLKTI